MAENKMAEVAKLLGVELEEEFELYHIERKEKLGGIHKLTEQSGLMVFSECAGAWCKGRYLLGLLVGSLEVKKLPYRPKQKETYWTYNLNRFDVVDVCWSDWAQEFALLKCGAVFRTKAEAIAARPRIYKELTGKVWTE